MKKFKKVGEFEGIRYYQEDPYGIFLDVEKYCDKSKIYIGSEWIPPDRGTLAPVVGLFEITGNQLCNINLPCETALKAFEHVYGGFREQYIFAFLDEGYGLVGDWSGEIEKDDFAEFKISRYRYKKFLVDFLVIMNPQKENEIMTYVYIQHKGTDFKVFCDSFNYELSEAGQREMLELYMREYIADFFCENAHKYYEVEGHWEDLRKIEGIKALCTDDGGNEPIDEELPFT